ncbi:hypothetical protein TIFTF001_013150 [Ficus carica]|uniref:Uncharacterized protein n=1 Tax=Ficus carica TaxID=3494 RepID=A0AA88A0D6_FICCA|nr:hypothetical protein TIFTF001_013150 [Ficus carica]
MIHLIKQLVIEPLASVACHVVFWKNDEILKKSRKGKLVSYNLGSRKPRNLSNSWGGENKLLGSLSRDEPGFSENKGVECGMVSNFFNTWFELPFSVE